MTAATKLKDACCLEGKLWPTLDRILKIRDISLSTQVRLVKAMVFPVVVYGCESWTIKKAEHWRVNAFALWCWRRFLRVPWTERRSNQTILKEINPKYSLEGLLLKLKLQYFGHLMRRADSLGTPWCWESLRAGGKGATEDEMVEWHYRLNGHEFEQTQEDSEGQGEDLVCYSQWGHKELDLT